MVSVRTPNDDDEKERFAEAIRQGLGVPLESYIGAVIGREPEQDLVDAIRLGIESHSEMDDSDSEESELNESKELLSDRVNL